MPYWDKSNTASSLDSGIYRYFPSSIPVFMSLLTGSGVIPASRTVSTVRERFVPSGEARLTVGAACGTVAVPTVRSASVLAVCAGAKASGDWTPVGLFFCHISRDDVCCMLRCIGNGFYNVRCAVYRFSVPFLTAGILRGSLNEVNKSGVRSVLVSTGCFSTTT